MRRLLSLVLLLSLSASAAAQRRRVVTPSAPLAVPGIEQIAAAALENVPGLSVAVRKGTAYYTGAWGLLDIETNVPVGTDSVFQIGSVTKQFTAAAILKLAEQGKLGIDDPVRRFIPELDSRFDPITIRHLLNHTSAITAYLDQVESLYEPSTQQEILALIMARPPTYAPGQVWSYSNSGYYLLGVVIERASNRTYPQYLREEFFEPLGLRETSYCGEQGPVPVGYERDPRNGARIEQRPIDVTLLYAAGALCSTAADLVRWNRALAAGHAVTPDSYARMIGESVPAYTATRYGFGLLIDDYFTHRRIWHNGLVYGFQSHVAHFPDDDLTIVVLVNHYGLRDRASETAEKITRAFLLQ